MKLLMSWLRKAMWHVRGFLFRGRVERRIDEDFQFHLEMRTQENIAAGMGPDEARRDARRRFGNQTYLADVSRDIRGGALLDTLWQDVRYGARMLLKHPGFTAVALATLALGIGANAAIFTVVHAVMLRPLPYDHPEQLTVVWTNLETMGASRAPATGIELREIRERSTQFQGLAGIWVANGTLTGDAEPEQVKVANVTANIFSVLGAGPFLGRTFLPEEERQAGSPPIILSYGLWVRRYGADQNIVGRSVRLEGDSRTVVGVMPRDFQLPFAQDANVPADIQVWAPFMYDIYTGDVGFLRLIGRLKPGVTETQAQEEANGIARQLRDKYAAFAQQTLGLQVLSLHGDAVRNARPALFALMIGAGLLLLISCANVANLLLTRATVRRREVALRAAMGASQWRLTRQLLTEGLLLGWVGGLLGLAVGWWTLKSLLGARPVNLPQLDSIQLNPVMLAFVAAVSIASGLLCALAPVLESRKVSLLDTLKGGGQSGIGPRTQRTRSLLIVTEVALGFLLIAGAGLMVRTLGQLEQVDPGFDPNRVLTFELNLPQNRYDGDEARTNFIREFEGRLAALPGIESIGAISHLPFDDFPNWVSPYAPEGASEDEKKGLLADHRAITPGFFRALGARLIEGRYFDEQDKAGSRSVVIVDEALAKRTWPNQSALGKKVEFEKFDNWDFTPHWAEVVGVVEHIKTHSLTEQSRGQIYIPFPQSARPHLSYTVRTRVEPLTLVGAIRSEVERLDKDLALSKVRPMTEYVSRARARTDFTAALSSLFGGVALLLAAVGIYGVVSYSAGQRTHEIGIRIAIGAQPRHVIKLVMGKGIVLAAAGVGIGLAAALTLTRFMSSLLFGVSSTDTATFAGASLLLASVALLANYLPARRATRVDPMIALRSE